MLQAFTLTRISIDKLRTIIILDLALLELCLLQISDGGDLRSIFSVVVGVNLSLSLFSIQFAFLSYNFSRYKPLFEEFTKELWESISMLVALPFLPILSCLWLSESDRSAMAIMALPLIALSAIDALLLVRKRINPIEIVKAEFSDSAMILYYKRLAQIISPQLDRHEAYLKREAKLKSATPMHEWSFTPTLFGLEKNDPWDRISLVVRLAVQNNDPSVFNEAFKSAVRMLELSFGKVDLPETNSSLMGGLQSLAFLRFSSLEVVS